MLSTSEGNSVDRYERVHTVSVAMAIADVFSKNGYAVPNKIAKILRIFEGLETPKSRWVISLH